MSSNAAAACAAVAATVLLTGAVVTAAVICPEAFTEHHVVVEPSTVVRVAPKHIAPPPGVPAYKIPVGQKFVVHNGTHCTVYGAPGNYYYCYHGVSYPVYYI